MAMNGRVKRGSRGWRFAAVAAVLAAALGLARPAAAKSIFESFADNLAARKAAQNPAATTATAAKDGAPARPRLLEVPDEAGAASRGQALKFGSAALALQKMSTETMTGTVGGLKDGAAAQDAKAISLGLESDENETLLATNMFKNKDIRRLLGDAPRFIYNPADRPDPMLVPWVRKAAIYKELAAKADSLAKAGQYDKAVAVYQRILQLDDPRFNGEVHAKLLAIAEKQNAKAVAAMQATKAVEERIDLPPWIHDNTTGVIVSPGRDMCLVGEYMLHIGDAVPNYPEVKIATITRHKVTYQIKNRNFDVTLNEN